MLNPDEVIYEEKVGRESVKICFSDADFDDNVVTIRVSLKDGMSLAKMLREQCSCAAQLRRKKKG